MQNKAAMSLSRELQMDFLKLGKRLKAARVRRRMSLADLAARTNSSVNTLRSLEQGRPTISLAVLARVLDVMRMPKRLSSLADPGEDRIGQAEELRRQPRRVHSPKSLEEEFGG